MRLLFSAGSIVRPLRNRDYAVYAAGNSFVMVAHWVQRIAVGWLAWQLTGSGTWLGALAFADLFPLALVGIVTGAIADRLNRLRIIQWTQALSTIQATSLFLLTVTGTMTIWHLLVLTLAQGIFLAFSWPARLAIIRSLVPREDLGPAVAMNSVIFNVARFIGPAIAGVLIAAWGVGAAFAINAIAFAIALVTLFMVTDPGKDPQPPNRAGVLSESWAAMRYALSHRGIAAILLVMSAVGIGARPIVDLLPGFADQILESGIGGLATLTSSMGFGSVVGGLWLAGRSTTTGMYRVTLFHAAFVALVMLLFLTMTWLPAAMACLAAASFGMTAIAISTQTAVQLSVSPAMGGRVMGLFMQTFRAAPAVGALLMGVASDYFGLRWPFVIGSGAILIVCAWGYVRREAIVASLDAPQE